jgi:hypothetical protein
MTGKIWRTTPPSRADTSAASPPFQHTNRPVNSSETALNLFSFCPDKILPGTLHHSGNRPAPPSEYTPLARRSAFARAERRHRGIWPHARGRSGWISAVPGRGRCCVSAHEPWNFAIPLPLCRGTGDFHESQRRRIYAYEVGNPGVLEVAIPDRRPGQVGKDRGKACPVGHAPRRVKDRSRAESRSAPIDVLIGVRAGYFRPPLHSLRRCRTGA